MNADWRGGMALDYQALPPISNKPKSSASDSHSDKQSFRSTGEEVGFLNFKVPNDSGDINIDESDDNHDIKSIDNQLNIIYELKQNMEEREGEEKRIESNFNSSGPCSELTSQMSEEENGRHVNIINESKTTMSRIGLNEEGISDNGMMMMMMGKRDNNNYNYNMKKTGTRSTTPNWNSKSGLNSCHQQKSNNHSDHRYCFTNLNHKKRAQSAHDFYLNLGDHQKLDEYEIDEEINPKSPLNYKQDNEKSKMNLEGPLDDPFITSLNESDNTITTMEPGYGDINHKLTGKKLRVNTTPIERKLNLNILHDQLSLNTNYQITENNLNSNEHSKTNLNTFNICSNAHNNASNTRIGSGGGISNINNNNNCEKMVMPIESSLPLPTADAKVMLSGNTKSLSNDQMHYRNKNESDMIHGHKTHHSAMSSEIEKKQKLQKLKKSFCKLPSSNSNMFNSNTIRKSEKEEEHDLTVQMNEKSDNLGSGLLENHDLDDSSRHHMILHNIGKNNHSTYEMSHDHIKTNESHIEDNRDQNTSLKLVTYDDKYYEKSSKSNSTKPVIKNGAENKIDNEEDVKNRGNDMRMMRKSLDLVMSSNKVKQLEGIGRRQQQQQQQQVIEKEEIKPSLSSNMIRMQNVIYREMGAEEKVERMWKDMRVVGGGEGIDSHGRLSGGGGGGGGNLKRQSLENNKKECNNDLEDKKMQSECYVRNEKINMQQNYLNEENEINKLEEEAINIEDTCINVGVVNDGNQMDGIHFDCHDGNDLILESIRREEEEEHRRRRRNRRRQRERQQQQHRFSNNHEHLLDDHHLITNNDGKLVPTKELLKERSKIKRKIQKMMREKGFEEFKHANTVLIENLNFSSNFQSHNVYDILEMNYPEITKALHCVNVPETLAYILMFDTFNEAKKAQESLDGIKVFGKVIHVHILSDFLVSTLTSEHEYSYVPTRHLLSASDLSTQTPINENYNQRHEIGDVSMVTPIALPILETQEYNHGNEMASHANSLLFNLMKNELTPESTSMNNHADHEQMLINEVMKMNREVKSHKIMMCSESDEGKSSSNHSNETDLAQFDELPLEFDRLHPEFDRLPLEFDKLKLKHKSLEKITTSKNEFRTSENDTLAVNQHHPLNMKYSKSGMSSREKLSSNTNLVGNKVSSSIGNVAKTPSSAIRMQSSNLVTGQINVGQKCHQHHQKLDMSCCEVQKFGMMMKERLDGDVLKTTSNNMVNFNRRSIMNGCNASSSSSNVEEQIRNARSRMTDLKNNLFMKYNMMLDEDAMHHHPHQYQQQYHQNRVVSSSRFGENMKSPYELKVNSSKLNLPIFKNNIGPTIQKTKLKSFFEHQQFQAMYILYDEEREQGIETINHQLTDLTVSKTEFMNVPLVEKTALCLCHIDKNEHLILHGIWTPQLQVSDEKEVKWKRSYKASPVNLTTSKDIYEIFNLSNDTELMKFLTSPKSKKHVFINDGARLNTMIQLLLHDASEYTAHRSSNRDFL